MAYKEIKRDSFTVEIDEPTLYVDNQSRKRSGHMTHALAEFAPGCFIDFNSNCSILRWGGHSPYGWIEYRISKDNGKTYSDVKTLEYSMQCLYDGMYIISVEKAVACSDGSIVAFCLKNDATHPTACEPWDTPMHIKSTDGGETWSEAREMSPYKGRTYDALYYEGSIYVLHHCNPHHTGETQEHVYRIYKSDDNGESFYELSTLPIDPVGRNYGAMIFDSEGNLHVYTHNDNALEHFDHAISYDNGKTWELSEPSYLARGLRNHQIAYIDGVYIFHGRSEDYEGFIMYTSTDASNWDEGTMIDIDKGASAFYSNNLNLRDENGNFLLIQYSCRYEGMKVNVNHMNLRIVK